MERTEYDDLDSDGKHACPDCGSHQTTPHPGCGCPVVHRFPNMFPVVFTRHINKYHHLCRERA